MVVLVGTLYVVHVQGGTLGLEHESISTGVCQPRELFLLQDSSYNRELLYPQTFHCLLPSDCVDFMVCCVSTQGVNPCSHFWQIFDKPSPYFGTLAVILLSSLGRFRIKYFNYFHIWSDR